MSEKTRELYDAVIGKIVSILNEMHPGNGFGAELLISDYEEAIMKSLQSAFPNARSRGCWFHYGQVSQNVTVYCSILGSK